MLAASDSAAAGSSQPADEPAPDRRENATAEAAGRVLIVEDVDGQRRTLSQILDREGFVTVACADGRAGLEAARRQVFAVAIVDHRLPDLSGTQVLEQLRVVDSDVQVILHTAYGSFDSAKDAVNLGAFGYLEKPSDPAELVRTVHRAAGRWMSSVLRRQDEQLRLLAAALEQAYLPILITDAATGDPGPVITYVNPAFERLSGYSSAELLGEPPSLLYGVKTQRDRLESLHERMRANQSCVIDLVHYRKDGTPFLMEVRVDPVRDDGGRITHWLRIFR